ncbi:C-5 cytosine-specific DNA methylase [Sinorhizobium meliloti]|nr:C-5 cytosine-specific DNA methylase [Sinorhizobium meliloti]
MFRTDLFNETSTEALMASALLGAPLIVDSFAGGGGASTGIELALGRSPDIAINHNAEALALHAANHPETKHLSENVYQVDPLDHLKGKHIGLAWFSPDCKHFSKAKGGKPVERNIRDLCWIIPGWIERIQKSGGRVDVVIMENVEEFKDYGPLIRTDRGLMPDPGRRGENFEKWCKKLRRLGGKIESRELRACDYGAPTIRKRLFVIIRFDGRPIVWPEPTHGKPEDPDVISGRKLPWRTAAECIDWSLPCPSIFDTSAEIWAKHQLRAVRPLADATMARVARGMKRYVLDAERPFLVQTGYGERAGQAPRAMSVDDPLGTAVAGGIKHAVVAPSVIRFNTGATGQDAREPLSTVTANGFIKRPGGAAPLGIIAPVLTVAQHGGKVRSIEEPTHTIAASRKDQNGVAVAFMAQHNNDSRRIGGVNPGRTVDEPISTVTQTGSQQGVVSAFVARQFGNSVGHSAEEPAATIMPGGDGKSQLVTPFLSHLYTSNTAGGQGKPELPLKTVTAGGGHVAIVSPYLQAYYGTGDGQHETEPMRTVTTKDRHGHVEATIGIPPFTEAQTDRARQVAGFMRSHGFWDDREFVTVDISGETFVIADIGMRMLTPRELYNAQGFPPNYIIEGAWDYQAGGSGPVWREFSKSVQVSCVGNSVSPPVARALVSANGSHLQIQREAA